jgi:hypothetical protein
MMLLLGIGNCVNAVVGLLFLGTYVIEFTSFTSLKILR